MEVFSDLRNLVRIPTEEEFEEMHKRSYEESLANPNNYSYWYPLINDDLVKEEFKIAKSWIYKLDYEHYKMIGDLYELRFKLPTDEFYQTDLYKQWQEYIKDLIKDLKFKTYNIKTETFSNKFDFSSCVCYKSEIPSKILDIFFKDFEVEAEGMTGFIVRELIQSLITIPTIYNGLPLNTEFRVFYDFDTHKVLYSCNYWDYNYCIDRLELTDKIIFQHELKRTNETFKEFQKLVEQKVDNCMKNIKLNGQWSIDIMYTLDEFYLIDMAIAQQSAYWKRR